MFKSKFVRTNNITRHHYKISFRVVRVKCEKWSMNLGKLFDSIRIIKSFPSMIYIH